MRKQQRPIAKKTIQRTSRKARAIAPPAKNGMMARVDMLWQHEKHVFIWIVVILTLLVLLNGIVAVDRMHDIAARDAVKTPLANNNFAVLQFKWHDDMSVNDKMFTLEKNFKVVGVTTQLLNLKKSNIWFAPSVESYVADEQGNRYGMVFADELTQPLIAGSYEPQQVARGDLTYAIPTSARKPQWCYKLADSNGGGEPLCFALNSHAQER